ncbi:unnamed protein product [Ceratitis capitata]|uniref:(Mediterranean fruit fly) hypothetical protein n=1 Tax=Ceratitis capitata TaxID=7213 RepID=A0A811UDA1_CERCA|nr:unnamed protein product [Ceratitis capitata]
MQQRNFLTADSVANPEDVIFVHDAPDSGFNSRIEPKPTNWVSNHSDNAAWYSKVKLIQNSVFIAIARCGDGVGVGVGGGATSIAGATSHLLLQLFDSTCTLALA